MSHAQVFLGSQGLGALPDWLGGLPQRPERAVLVPTAGNRLAAAPWVDTAIDALTGWGLELRILDLEGSPPPVAETALHHTDLVFVTGGDPLFLLEHARRSGFVPAVRDAVAQGRLAYAGVSAGAILTAADLTPYRAPDDPEPAGGHRGLDLVPFYPLVHANRGRQERYARLIAAHPDLTFVTYRDDEAITVTGSTWRRHPSAVTASRPGTAPAS